MQLQTKTVRQGINKAFLKEPVERPEFDNFKNVLSGVLDQIDHAVEADEHEEHLKNLLPPFFKALGFDDHKINTSGRIDLAIYTGTKKNDPVGVLMEVKRPGNKAEMITKDNFNKKALHEAVLYYLEQRIEEGNTDLKHVIITNMHDWFIFDAQEFERCFYKPSVLRKTWKSWKADQKVSSNNDFMYNEIAKYIDQQDTSITGLYIPLDKTRKLLGGQEGSDYEKKLIPLFKLFTPIHLLKESFANDSNSLNREFYRELLYILGLEETTEGNTRYIRRVSEEHRNPGSMIENTIRILDAEDHLSTLSEPVKNYGEDKDDQLFGVALELCITWMNRVLFLKLLEAQLFRYHRGDKKFKFLNSEELAGFDALNTLFFQVLARRTEERSEAIKEKFGHIPYLNSSLFDVSDLEHDTTRISGLTDTTMPVYNRSVLNELRGNELSTLDYLFRFLEAFDFSAEGKEEIRSERKSLINASVLGLIFEKINGYKDGSFYTPGFITEYMARETLRKAVVDKFIEYGGIENGEELTISDLYNHIGPNRSVSIKEANEIVNSITICDPAVGSGHFLVSCLNELLAIKSDLGILCDVDGKAFRDLNVMVENDELIVSYGDDELFEYDVSHTWQGQTLASRKIASERQRIQQALFHEKRFLIENCLFGVDINSNSVKICRLRLWIELLKRAFYTPGSEYLELEVLPNIDINIKQGNSLVSRFELDSDLSSVFKDSDHSLEDYKEAVRNYKHTGDRSEKKRLQNLIGEIKEEYTTTLTNIRPINKKLSKERGRLELMQNADLFGEQKFTKKDIKKQKKKVEKLEEQKADEESGAFYNQAFEWRFEFPEVLDEEGKYIGFDVVIGNPPYLSGTNVPEQKDYLRSNFETAEYQLDLYVFFIERGANLIKQNAYISFITPNSWLKNMTMTKCRKFVLDNIPLISVNPNISNAFEEATVDTLIFLGKKSKEEKSLKVWHFKEEEVTINHEINSLRFANNEGLIFNVLVSEFAQKILDKIRSESKNIEELFDITRGVNPYDKYTGQSQHVIKNKVYHSDHAKDETFVPEIRGKHIDWFVTKWDKKHFISYGEWLAAPRDPKFFTGQRIVMREILGDRFICTLLEDDIIIDRSLYIAKPIKKEVDPKYVLGILGSKLMVWFFRYERNEFDDLFPKIRVGEFKTLPIKVSKSQEELSDLVSKILAAKKENPETDTSKLEAEIDQLVYELYGLSEEEIGIVEGSVG
ncbi:DUF7149 domain-containing protein [Gracilimonas mengyeensis]|nr:TaqI-like C-terminal specificity domain-containing protein [Gracilimonas mengyeensis]